MKIKKGDKVIINAGKDNGKTGKVIQIFPQSGKIVVEGVNIIKKHIKARKEGQKGQKIELSSPFDASNASFFCEHCQKGVKVGYKTEGDKKVRICKKCKEDI